MPELSTRPSADGRGAAIVAPGGRGAGVTTETRGSWLDGVRPYLEQFTTDRMTLRVEQADWWSTLCGRGSYVQHRWWGGQYLTYSQWCQVEQGLRSTRCVFLRATSSEESWGEKERKAANGWERAL